MNHIGQILLQNKVKWTSKKSNLKLTIVSTAEIRNDPTHLYFWPAVTRHFIWNKKCGQNCRALHRNQGNI